MPLGELRSLSPDSVPSYGANDTPLFGRDGVTVSDVIDIINPLQHIPFVSALYNEITGNTPKMGSQLLGGVLYGGPVGVFASAINLVFQGETGHGIVGAVVAGVMGESTEAKQIADATPEIPSVEVLATESHASINHVPVSDHAGADLDIITQTPLAEILPPIGKSAKPTTITPNRAQDVLSLFDAAAADAQRAYRKAQGLSAQTTSTRRDLMM